MYQTEQIKPYSNTQEKVTQVGEMFDNIAPSYDFLNHFLSWGTDKGWRRQAVLSLAAFQPQRILDVATGTGDFALLMAHLLKPTQIVGADISEGMMRVGREKVQAAKLEDVISFEQQDCTHMSYPDASFDAVTVAYGLRNFQDMEAGLREMCRVLKPQGHLLVVELATPPHFPMRQLFWCYAHLVMPVVGCLVSGDSKAFRYLPASMEAFPQAEVLEKVFLKTGFSDIVWKRFTFGLCTMYLATK